MNEFFETAVWGNTVGRWLAAAGIAIGVYVVLRLLVRVGGRRLAQVATETPTDVDDIVAAVLSKTRSGVLLPVAVFAGTLPLTLPSRLEDAIGHVAFFAVALQVGIWVSAGFAAAVESYRDRVLAEDPGSATGTTAISIMGRVVIWVLVMLVVIDNLGMDVTALVTSLGIGGIAVALAVQSILGDMFASLSIIFDKPFVIGDFLAVGDSLGKVENIGLKTTRLRSLTGEQLVMSNSDLLSSRIRNYGRMFERRGIFTLGVTYDTPRDKLARIPDMVREVIEREGNARFDRAHFKEYGAYSLNIEAVYYVLSPEYAVFLDVQERINLGIHERFENEGIQFAFPTQVVHVVPPLDESAATAG